MSKCSVVYNGLFIQKLCNFYTLCVGVICLTPVLRRAWTFVHGVIFHNTLSPSCISSPPPPPHPFFLFFFSFLLLYKPCLKLLVMSHVFGLTLNVSISLYNGTRDERPPLLIQLFLTPPFPPNFQVNSPLPNFLLFLKVFPIMFPCKYPTPC